MVLDVLRELQGLGHPESVVPVQGALAKLLEEALGMVSRIWITGSLLWANHCSTQGLVGKKGSEHSGVLHHWGCSEWETEHGIGIRPTCAP